MFSAFGSRVSIIGRSERLLRSAGRDDRASGSPSWPARRWDVQLGQEVVGARGARGDVTARAGRRHRRSAATCCWSPPAGCPTATCSTCRRPACRPTDDGRIVVDDQPAHRRSTGSSRWATSARRTSSSTWPTTRPGWCAQPAAPGLAAAQRPPVRAVGGVHRPADRRGRADRGAVPGRGLDVRRGGAGVRRRRLRLGDGGHHRLLQGDRRARHRPAARRARHRARRRRR